MKHTKDINIDILKAAIESERIAHAYLFLGQDIKGMEDVAIMFAKLLNCVGAGATEKGLNFCDKCISCLKINHKNHPDLKRIYPEGLSRQIKIGNIRDLQKDIYLKAIEAKKKVYIINETDRMTEEAANCLLKTLEEPPGECVIILISSNLSSILPTIVSRCQVIRFYGLGDDGIVANDEDFRIIDELLDVKNAFLGRELEIYQLPRQGLTEKIKLLLAFLRDVLIYKTTKDASHIFNNERMDAIADKAACYSQGNLLEMINAAAKARVELELNANPNLVIDNLLGGYFYKVGTPCSTKKTPEGRSLFCAAGCPQHEK